MRNILLLLSVFLFSNCSDDIEDSNQTIQGEYNGLFFRSEASSAKIDENGYLIIEGSARETVILQVESPEVGIYDITASNNNQALFAVDSQLYLTEGESTGGTIEIESINDGSVSGNFFFDARLNGLGERLNFNKGVFFRIPFEDSGADDDNGDGTINENFQALVDGADFNADVTQTTISNNILNISGIQSDVIISITLTTELEPGDYDITTDGEQNATYTQNENAESAVDGTLTIDTLDENQITGSFSFTTENGIEITQGQFELEL